MPTLAVTRVGKAKPASYSKIKFFLLMCVSPHRKETPGKGKLSPFKKAIPKFDSVKENFKLLSVCCCAILFAVRSGEKHKNNINFSFGYDYSL